MTTTSATSGGVRTISGSKLTSVMIWGVGCYMTHAFFTQMNFGGDYRLFLAVVIQVVLSIGQSPVWSGRGNILSWALLIADAVINFGGCMSFSAGLDKTGSVQALLGSFAGWTGDIPTFIEAFLALFIAAIVAGLPEYLWKRG